ncbi:MAG: DUF3177 family protein [Chloroflexi bacterium]|nr:DUF3177 family protein [Chloroflexota bacterium]
MQSIRSRIHADFVLAVILTVIIPFGLLLRSLKVPAKYYQRIPFLAYWRASSLLMVTVYLLIAQRSYAMVSGITARIAIASALLRFPYQDDGFVRWWVWMTVGYCLSGAAINSTQICNVAVRREYESATQVYAHLFHHGHDVRMLGRVGDVGVISWVVGAIVG